ncbi:MAG: DUF2203 domain-containing protein [Euryarchaeota archaeon]|nr:DUF2203 domain-containing protein [Euryarchaeota archaeon]
MTDTQLDIAASPRRIFTVEEANHLLSQIEGIFREMDTRAARVRELSDLVTDFESYWGKAIEDSTNADNEKYVRLKEELATGLQAVNDCAIRLSALGCELKDPNRGLVDFYAYVGGELVYLCWQRGEKEIGYWHTLEAGFPGRRPLYR